MRLNLPWRTWLQTPRALWAAIIVVTLLALGLMSLPLDSRGWEVNAGFLIFGALLTTAVVLLSDSLRREAQARNLAHALYVELVNRVARCCFDYEAPWEKFGNTTPSSISASRTRKFAPFEPIIYASTARDIALLQGDAAQRLIQFYYQLAAWQRDVETTCEEVRLSDRVESRDIDRLAYRLHQTLEPGLEALRALGPMVDGWEQLDAAAIAYLDKFRGSKPDGTLQDRLARLVKRPPKSTKAKLIEAAVRSSN